MPEVRKRSLKKILKAAVAGARESKLEISRIVVGENTVTIFVGKDGEAEPANPWLTEIEGKKQ